MEQILQSQFLVIQAFYCRIMFSGITDHPFDQPNAILGSVQIQNRCRNKKCYIMGKGWIFANIIYLWIITIVFGSYFMFEYFCEVNLHQRYGDQNRFYETGNIQVPINQDGTGTLSSII